LALSQEAFERAVPLVAGPSAGASKTLEAHELQVLLSAGNPERTQAAPAWRSVRAEA